MKFATVYDPETKTKHEIPISELAPFMVKGTLVNDGSVCWIDSRKLKPNHKLLHPPFSGQRRRVVKQLHKDLVEVFPRSANEWERAFRCDQHPDREIKIWQWIAYQYQVLIASNRPSLRRKNDYFRLCRTWSWTKNKQEVLETTSLEELTREDASRLMDSFVVVPANFFGGDVVKFFPGVNAIDYATIKSLDEFKEKAAGAPTIFAVDWNTGKVGCAYGQQALMDSVEDSQPSLAVFFAVDFDTDHLEHLLSLVGATKGWFEWNGEKHSGDEMFQPPD